MMWNYEVIMECVKNIDDFQKLTKLSGDLLKIKYIKYSRLVQKISVIHNEKLKYVKAQDFLNACEARDKERPLLIELSKLLILEKNEK